MTAGQLAEQFDISAPSMSHHFSVLKLADLVATRRCGQQIFYSLNTTVFQDVLVLLMELLPETQTMNADIEAAPKSLDAKSA